MEHLTDEPLHEHDWLETGPKAVRREGSKAAYVSAPVYWCRLCGATKHDGKVSWPSMYPRLILDPAPLL